MNSKIAPVYDQQYWVFHKQYKKILIGLVYTFTIDDHPEAHLCVKAHPKLLRISTFFLLYFNNNVKAHRPFLRNPI